MKLKLTDKKARQRVQGRNQLVMVRISPQVRRHLLAFGRANVISANGNLSHIAEAAINITMLHREFLHEATNRFARYAKAEGFEPNQHYQLIESMLAAR